MSHSHSNLTQARWLALPGGHPDACLLRADYRGNLLAVVRVIGWAADWRTLRSRPTIARITERAGLSERTVQRWCRWLEQRGFLRVLEPGTTPQFSPGVLAKDAANNAREWLLVGPAVTPTGFSDPELEAPTRAHARGANTKNTTPHQKGGRPPRSSQHEGRPGLAAHRVAHQGDTRDLASHPVLRRISPRMLAHLLRPWIQAGWTAADVRHALEFRPDGTQHCHRDRVRFPGGWLRYRMSVWTESGQPLPPHSAELAERAARARAERFVAPAPQPPEVAVTGAALARELLKRGRPPSVAATGTRTGSGGLSPLTAIHRNPAGASRPVLHAPDTPRWLD